jgi:hypothetical protein
MEFCSYCETEVDTEGKAYRIERTLDAEPPAHCVWWEQGSDGKPDFDALILHECKKGKVIDKLL